MQNVNPINVPLTIEATATDVGTPRIETRPVATHAETDAQLLETWLAEMGSDATRKNFRRTVEQFLDALPMGLGRQARGCP
jgi:hypothetical protein